MPGRVYVPSILFSDSGCQRNKYTLLELTFASHLWQGHQNVLFNRSFITLSSLLSSSATLPTRFGLKTIRLKRSHFLGYKHKQGKLREDPPALDGMTSPKSGQAAKCDSKWRPEMLNFGLRWRGIPVGSVAL